MLVLHYCSFASTVVEVQQFRDLQHIALLEDRAHISKAIQSSKLAPISQN